MINENNGSFWLLGFRRRLIWWLKMDWIEHNESALKYFLVYWQPDKICFAFTNKKEWGKKERPRKFQIQLNQYSC